MQVFIKIKNKVKIPIYPSIPKIPTFLMRTKFLTDTITNILTKINKKQIINNTLGEISNFDIYQGNTNFLRIDKNLITIPKKKIP